MKKLFRLWHLITASFVVTLLVFAYRYVWFATETIPSDRIDVAGTAMVCSFLISVAIEIHAHA